jgi:hypothetical protein
MEIMPEIVEELGLDELPMGKQDFNFYTYAARTLARATGLPIGDAEDRANDFIEHIFTHIPKKKTRPSVYDYIRRYQKQVAAGSAPQTFDGYFKMNLSREIANIFNERKRFLNRPKIWSIDRGVGSGEEGDIGEWFLPQSSEPSPYEVLRFQEENPKKEKAFAAVPKMLSDHRNGAAYVEMWDLMKKQRETGKKYTDDNIANILNSMQLEPEGGAPEWTGGAVAKSRYIILELVRKLMREYKVDPESIFGSRNGFRFGLSMIRG